MTKISAKVVAFGYVYLTTNLINNKIYIGQRKYTNKKDELYLGSGVLLKKAINKYGVHNFKKEILTEGFSKEQLDEIESFYIKELNSLIPNGYNIKEKAGGGAYLQNHPNRDEIRQKISRSLKGMIYSKERNKKISEAHKGRKKPQSVIDKIKLTKKNNPYKRSKESIRKGVEIRKANGSYKSNRLGKNHVEIFGAEKAEKMRKVNSDKHKKINKNGTVSTITKNN